MTTFHVTEEWHNRFIELANELMKYIDKAAVADIGGLFGALCGVGVPSEILHKFVDLAYEIQVVKQAEAGDSGAN